jgi:Asp-tRNA(Asn)/Glu-tRNA(Gln) amidotransferase A subunit family amidase
MTDQTTTYADLSASDAARHIAKGELTSEELVQACIERIEDAEPTVQAWQSFDPEFALMQAREADRIWAAHEAMGPLHGVPIGIKDIIDTISFPTENGSALHKDRQTTEDAAVVSMLRQAGAIIMGKTVTTEFAVYTPGKTRNPHNPEHTPGGSSSGSAAAVACNMIPAALGTQTNGSVIRPASYCGVYGYKPSHGLISRSGILDISRALDTVGVFARSIEDLGLIASAIMTYDEYDTDMRPRAVPKLADIALSAPPVEPDLVFMQTPIWNDLEGTTQEAFAELMDVLGPRCEAQELPYPFEDAWRWHKTIMLTDIACRFHGLYEENKSDISAKLAEMIEEGRTLPAVDYAAALEWREQLSIGINAVFEDYDAIITPAAFGEAPKGLEDTGSPACCTLWTYLGLPAITIPLLEGPNGLPIGVQLVGKRGSDARLLRTAHWLTEHLSSEIEQDGA